MDLKKVIGKSTKGLDIFRNFIPVVILFLFIVYTKASIYVASTYLGKCIAILLIVLYSTKDVLYGILVCLIIILFYQTTGIEEGFSQISPSEFFGQTRDIQNLPFTFDIVSDDHDIVRPRNEDTIPDDNMNQIIKLLKSLQSSAEIASINNLETTEPFTAGDYLPMSEDVSVFQNQHCVNHKLMYKNFQIKPEMAQHVFREIEYVNSNDNCNLCDPKCQFTVDKIMVEDELLRHANMDKHVNKPKSHV